LGAPIQTNSEAASSWSPAIAGAVPGAGDGLVKLSVYEIDANPFQPRRQFDEAEIAELCQSLKEHGLLQPIVVRRSGERYQLIAGERRLRAAIKAGWSEVPAQLKQADDREVAELAIVENLQRKDLNALEKAASFQQYLETYHCTQEELAQRLAIDRSTVANLIRLLELPDDVQDAVRRGAISPGHARALLPLGDEQEQVRFSQRIQAEGLSVRATESLVQEMIRQADAEPLAVIGADGQVSRPVTKRSDQLASLEQELRTTLGTKVELKLSRSGRGKIIIHFNSHDEFERLMNFICPTRQQRGQAG
jgi:ParB family chromosome partitioning protein